MEIIYNDKPKLQSNEALIARVLVYKIRTNNIEHQNPNFIKWRKYITKQLKIMAKWEQ